MSKVAKSLSDLDALADEVLSKSVKDDKEDLKPEEISENVPDDASKDNPENNAPAADEPKSDDVKKDDTDDKKDAEDGAEEDLEKCVNADDVKKSEESDPVPEDDEKDESKEDVKPEDDSDEEDEDVDNKEDLEKSIKSDFASDEEVKKGMDASEFLSSVVEILSKSLADAAGEIQISRADSKQSASILAKSLQATLSLNKSMAAEMTELKKENAELKKSIVDGLGEIKATLDEVLSQPVGMRKSVKNIQVMDRNFQKSLNGDAATGIENLSKSQILDILVSEMHAGNQAVTAGDIVAYESGAPLHAGLVALVNSKCK